MAAFEFYNVLEDMSPGKFNSCRIKSERNEMRRMSVNFVMDSYSEVEESGRDMGQQLKKKDGEMCSMLK